MPKSEEYLRRQKEAEKRLGANPSREDFLRELKALEEFEAQENEAIVAEAIRQELVEDGEADQLVSQELEKLEEEKPKAAVKQAKSKRRPGGGKIL
jgi:hypothetical protein